MSEPEVADQEAGNENAEAKEEVGKGQSDVIEQAAAIAPCETAKENQSGEAASQQATEEQILQEKVSELEVKSETEAPVVENAAPAEPVSEQPSASEEVHQSAPAEGERSGCTAEVAPQANVEPAKESVEAAEPVLGNEAPKECADVSVVEQASPASEVAANECTEATAAPAIIEEVHETPKEAPAAQEEACKQTSAEAVEEKPSQVEEVKCGQESEATVESAEVQEKPVEA